MKNNSLRQKAGLSLQELEKLNEQQSLAVLNALLVGYEHLACMDLIEQTTFYKQSLKYKVKAVVEELEKTTTALADIMGVDDIALANLMEHKKQLMQKIASLRPEHKSGLNALLEQYIAMPDLTLHRLGIKIIDRDA